MWSLSLKNLVSSLLALNHPSNTYMLTCIYVHKGVSRCSWLSHGAVRSPWGPVGWQLCQLPQSVGKDSPQACGSECASQIAQPKVITAIAVHQSRPPSLAERASHSGGSRSYDWREWRPGPKSSHAVREREPCDHVRGESAVHLRREVWSRGVL